MSSGISNLNIEDDLAKALQRAKQLAAVNTNSSNGQKRSISDDLNFQSAKRPNSGSNMAMANMGMVGQMMVWMLPLRPLKFLTMLSDLLLAEEVSKSPPFNSMHTPSPKHSIDKARQMIAEVLDRSRTGGMGGLVGGGNGQNGSATTSPWGNHQGLAGVNWSEMLLIQDNQQVSMGPKPLRITGFPDKVEQAKRVVEQLMNSEDGGGGGAGVPFNESNDAKWSEETGAKIQFKPDEDSSTPDRCAVIQGTPEQINRATQMISDLVTRSSQGGGAAEVFFMHVPANKTGLVIGKGGDTIKQICGETGAHVELSREPPPNANEKVFVIKGTLTRSTTSSISSASRWEISLQALLFLHSTALSQLVKSQQAIPMDHHQFGAGDQFGQAAQWAQNINPGGQDASQQQQVGFAAASAAQPSFGGAPAQHYQAVGGVVNVGQQMHHQQQAPQPVQQQQQHMHQQAQAVQQPAVQQQQVAAGGDAAAINPQTGQPDYSAQWAQYYRTMGMHEQAALIESQMKQQQQPQNAGVGQARPQQVFYNP
uniref:K Homology domain-containing protein n=1 Tax=Ditylenchus dipsaci TaxID=166011 RepID=A0A915DRQ4_9BILA